MIKIENTDLYFFKYQLYGITYLKFYKNLKNLGITFLTDHNNEFFYLKRYREYGPVYLRFLRDAIKLKLDEIIDIKDFRESRNGCILKWVFKNFEERGRIENN